MKKGVFIAEGRTAEVFAWGKHEVIKLFLHNIPVQPILREVEISHFVRQAGLPVPAVSDIIEIEDRKGIIFERIRGPTMLKVMHQKPWNLSSLLRQFAELHVLMHHSLGTKLPSQRKELKLRIRNAPNLKTETKEKRLQALSQMQEGNVICHEDYHAGNVVMSPQGPVIIDWAKATCGNPIANIAKTSLKFRLAIRVGNMSIFERWLGKPTSGIIDTLYLRWYGKRRSFSREQYKAWIPLIATAYQGTHKYSPKQAQEKIEKIFHLKGFKAAEEWLKKAIEEGHAKEDYLNQIALKLFKKSYPDIALKYGERALEINPDNENLGRILANLARSRKRHHTCSKK